MNVTREYKTYISKFHAVAMNAFNVARLQSANNHHISVGETTRIPIRNQYIFSQLVLYEILQ